MALPSFVKNATGLDDGVTNSLASSLSKLKSAQYGMDEQLEDFDDILSTVNGSSFPPTPSIDDMYAASAVVDADVQQKLFELEEIADLTGSCLDGAMNSLKSISDNGYGLVKDSLAAFEQVANMPSEMADLGGIYSKAQQFAASLGIDRLVADLNSKLGCLSDSSMISDIQNEVSLAMSYLGLDSSGLPDNAVYYNKMKSDMASWSSAQGFASYWGDDVSSGLDVVTTTSNGLSILTKTTADAQISSVKGMIKNLIPSVPMPPSYF